MAIMHILVIAAIVSIWLLLAVNVVLTVAGFFYYMHCEKEQRKLPVYLEKELPFVSVMIPAHNEGKVIVRTVESILALRYPKDRYEIIVINDHSTDESEVLLEQVRERYRERNLTIIHTDGVTGGKGKSNALNIGYAKCRGDFIAIYDADNTPEENALFYLASELQKNESLGAVIGKFRTRNKEVNLLTRFINIETLSFQWMAQAGRWQLFKLSTIPGTNFIIRRSILEAIGGWDVKAVAEDTEISFRIYLMGYKIKFLPYAVTWEQEPQTLRVWFKQRTRWVKGNIYVLVKNLPLVWSRSSGKVRFDVCYFLAIYFLLLSALILSDVLLLGTLFGFITMKLAFFGNLLWGMALVLFVAETFVTLSTEKGEMNAHNLFVTILMYFTYSKLWMAVAFYGLFQYCKDRLLHREAKWYKTERF